MRRRDFILGAGALGLQLSAPGAFALAQPQRHILRHRVEDFGARGDGSSDDAGAFRAAAAAGVVCQLKPRALYAIGSRVTVGSHAGFACEAQAGAEILMLSGQGRFDLATYERPFGPNHVAFLAQGADGPVLEGLQVRLQPTGQVRCAIPFAIRGCRSPRLAAEISGFKESYLGLVSWDSNREGEAEIFAHDCGADSTVLPSMQVSAMEIDNNRLGGASSEGWRVRMRVRSLELGPQAIARYGCQTDGLTVMSAHAGGTVEYIDAAHVAEPLDCWGDGVIVKAMRLKDIDHYAVKLIYGASRCHISNVTVDGTGLAGVVIAGHSNAQRPWASTGNRIENVQCSNVGALLPKLGRLNPRIYRQAQPGFYIDGNQARWQPDHNLISGRAHGFSRATMSSVGACSSTGAGNAFEIDGDTFSGGFFSGSGAAASVRRPGQAASGG